MFIIITVISFINSARSHEAYVKNYAMVFIHDENLAMRDMRTDELHDTVSLVACSNVEHVGNVGNVGNVEHVGNVGNVGHVVLI